MSFLDAIILGIVEGITEFLPISSTAHLMMASKILEISQSEFVKSFEIMIQLGAIVAVLFTFGGRLVKTPSLWKKIAIAFIPTAIIGFFLYEFIKVYLIGNLLIAVLSLIIGGLILIGLERFVLKSPAVENDTNDITSKQAFIIGVVQSLAIIPGVSRSAATIVPALLFGASRRAAAEFSFLLAVPTIGAAVGYDLVKNFGTLDGNIVILIIGFGASFVAAVLSIKFLLSFIQNHSYSVFGIYRIIIAALFFLVFLA